MLRWIPNSHFLLYQDTAWSLSQVDKGTLNTSIPLVFLCRSSEVGENPSQSPPRLLHNLLEELDGVTTNPSRRRQPPRVTSQWRLLDVHPSALNSHIWCDTLGSLDHSLECNLKQSTWVRVFGKLRCAQYMLGMAKRASTHEPLVFIPFETLLAVMGNFPLSAHSVDGPHSRTRRYTIQVKTSFPIRNLSDLSKKANADGPPTPGQMVHALPALTPRALPTWL
jgi:hypothetical protein